MRNTTQLPHNPAPAGVDKPREDVIPEGFELFHARLPKIYAFRMKELGHYRVGSPTMGYSNKRVRAGHWIVRIPGQHDMSIDFGGVQMTDDEFRKKFYTPEAMMEDMLSIIDLDISTVAKSTDEPSKVKK